jgi:hypothetical protein
MKTHKLMHLFGVLLFIACASYMLSGYADIIHRMTAKFATGVWQRAESLAEHALDLKSRVGKNSSRPVGMQTVSSRRNCT